MVQKNSQINFSYKTSFYYRIHIESNVLKKAAWEDIDIRENGDLESNAMGQN